MARTEYFEGTSGQTYYVKPVPVTTPWATDAIVGTADANDGRLFAFASLDEDVVYRIFNRATGTPLVTDEPVSSIGTSQVDLVDAPNATAVTAIQDGLATSAALAVVDGIVDDILVDTSTTIPDQVTNLNDLSTSDIDARLSAYDGPTQTELLAVQSSIEAACATVTTTQIRAAMSGRWTDEDANTFDLVVTDTP